MCLKELFESYCNSVSESKDVALSEAKKILEKTGYWEETTETIKENLSTILKTISKEIRQLSAEERINVVSVINGVFSPDSFDLQRWGSNNREYFLQSEKLYDQTEIFILLLKYLQSGERTAKKNQEDIAKHFCVSNNTVSKWMGVLQNGTELLGSVIKISAKGRGNQTYDSTIHPVFLALNLSEVNFLTVILPTLISEYGFYKDIANNISGDVYRQLSDYARKTIDKSATSKGIYLTKSKAQYRHEDQLDPVFLEKRSIASKCNLTYDTGEEMYGGFSIEFEDNHQSLFFVTESGERHEIDPNRIVDIEWDKEW